MSIQKKICAGATAVVLALGMFAAYSSIGSFVAPQGHGMDVDSKGFAYLGQDTVRKYDVKTGKLVGEVPRAPEREPGVPNVPDSVPMHKPGVGGAGPVAGFIPPPAAAGG